MVLLVAQLLNLLRRSRSRFSEKCLKSNGSFDSGREGGETSGAFLWKIFNTSLAVENQRAATAKAKMKYRESWE